MAELVSDEERKVIQDALEEAATEVQNGVDEMVEGVRDTEDRAEDAVEEVLLTLVW